jgi:uncharacterized membrane protein HdeD (DUF308 family)
MPYYFTKGRGNDIAIVLIGILDVISGIIVYFSRSWSLASNSVVALLTLFYFCLGIWSLATNVIRRNYYDWRGIVDLIAAITLLLMYYGNVYGIFWIIGIIIAIKGIMGIFLITTKG